MIKITKREAEVMRNKGYGEFVKHSHTKHKTYYLVEEPDTYKYDKKARKNKLVKHGVLSILKDYRKSIGITD